MRADVVLRYAEARLPRYTSYPTAPQFTGAVTPETYGAWLASLPGGGTGSLYLHIPFCRSMCWYCGCHTTITRRDDPIVDYLDLVRAEIALVAGRLSHLPRIRHVHLGGGTPTIMEPAPLVALMALLRDRFPFDPDAEIAVEIDPRTLGPVMARALGEAGVTRASLGVQSFDPLVQRAINRVQSFDQTAAATAGLRRAGIGGINFDLIYGLPHQSVASCIDTVRQCLRLRPDRFAVFGYAHVPTFKKHQRKIDETALPDAAARGAQAEAIAEALTEAGYCRIGLDHYALPGDSLAAAQRSGALHRNFQGYTTDASEVLLGFGASAIGRLPQGFVQNETALGRYADRVSRGGPATARGCATTAEDRLRAEVIERLMCDFRVDLAAVCARHGRSGKALLQSTPRITELAADGVVRLDGTTVTVAEDARVLVRSVASAFDAYLGHSGRPHSRAV